MNPKKVNLFQYNTKPNELNNSQYGLGWFVAKSNGSEIFAHDGAIEGFQSALVIMPEMGKGIIVMTNCYNGVAHIPHEISVGILNILAGKKPGKQSKILFYSIRALPILALALFIILFFVLKRWMRLHKPLIMTKKIVPNLLLLLGVIIGLGWIIFVPNFFKANLRNALDFDISSGISLILLTVLTIALSFIIYFNQNSKTLPNT